MNCGVGEELCVAPHEINNLFEYENIERRSTMDDMNNTPAPEQPAAAAPVQPPQQQIPPQQQQIPPPLQQAPLKPPLPHKTTDTLLAALSFITAFLFWRWGAWGGMTGIALTYGLFFVSVTAFAGRHAVRALRWDLLLSGATALALALSFAIYDDPAFYALKLCVVIFLTAWYLCGLYQRTRYSDGSLMALLDIAALLIVWPLKYISTSTRTLFRGGEGRRSQLKLAIIGLVASVPVLIVAATLLSQADAAFQEALRRFLDTIGVTMLQAFLALLLFFPLFSLLFGLTRGEELPGAAPPAEVKGGRLEPVIASSFLGAISLLYLCFLFTQLAYFFNGFRGLLPEEYSAAQYARRGFFELCAVAAINLGLVLLVSGLTRKRESFPRLSAPPLLHPNEPAGSPGTPASEGGFKKLPAAVQALSAFICVFTLLLIATAESKMALYVSLFGMTRMRLRVSLFILLLAFAFVLLLAQLFLRKFAYMKALLAAGCVLILCMSFADIDRVVLRYNMWAYETGRLETLDVAAFDELGDAKIPYLIELAYSEDADMKQEALLQLHDWQMLRGRVPQGFSEYNYTQRKAVRAMEEFLDREDCPLERRKSSLEEIIGDAIREGAVRASKMASERMSEIASEIASARER